MEPGTLLGFAIGLMVWPTILVFLVFAGEATITKVDGKDTQDDKTGELGTGLPGKEAIRHPEVRTKSDKESRD